MLLFRKNDVKYLVLLKKTITFASAFAQVCADMAKLVEQFIRNE